MTEKFFAKFSQKANFSQKLCEISHKFHRNSKKIGKRKKEKNFFAKICKKYQRLTKTLKFFANFSQKAKFSQKKVFQRCHKNYENLHVRREFRQNF